MQLSHLWEWFSFGNVVTFIFTIYCGYTSKTFYDIMYPVAPLTGDGLGEQVFYSLWESGQLLQIHCYLSGSRTFQKSDFSNAILAWSAENVPFSWEWPPGSDGGDDGSLVHITQTVNAWMDSAVPCDEEDSLANCDAIQTTDSTSASVRAFWKALQTNRTVFMHVHVSHMGASPNPADSTYDKLKHVHASVPAVKFLEKQVERGRLLLNDPFDVNNISSSEETPPFISHWKPEMTVKLLTDHNKYDFEAMSKTQIFHNLYRKNLLSRTQKGVGFLPLLHVDEMGLTRDKFISLDSDGGNFSLELSYSPMSASRFAVMSQFEASFEMQKEMGFGQNDIDDLRNMIAGTNPYLLTFTFAATFLHLLFDVLAFKSDIEFWKKQKTFKGISIRSQFIDLFSQIVVALYLYNENGSLLVLLPSVFGVAVQVWKVARASGSFIVFRYGFIPMFESPPGGRVQDPLTESIDKKATMHLSLILFPLVVGFSMYSILVDKHVGWYSWVLASLTGTVYAFGFITMTPQLFMNYKLKSVAHLPWKFMIYRALNTFIDDLFAFIIRMPTMHRVSCFRDDIVFFIYLYQRWIYPVDKERQMDADDMPSKDD